MQYSSEFTPTLAVGDVARLFRGTSPHLDVLVVGVRASGIHVHDFGTISTSLLDQECPHLQVEVGELGEWRFVPQGRFRCLLSNPQGVNIMDTRGATPGQTTSWFIDPQDDLVSSQSINNYLFAASTCFSYGRDTPRVSLYSLTPNAQVEGYVHYFGYVYALRRSTVEPTKALWVSGRATGSDLGA